MFIVQDDFLSNIITVNANFILSYYILCIVSLTVTTIAVPIQRHKSPIKLSAAGMSYYYCDHNIRAGMPSG